MSLIGIYKKQLFHPNLISLFINPFFIVRWLLLKKLRKFAPELKGRILDFGCGQKPYKDLFTSVTDYMGVDIENEAHNHEKEDVDIYYDGVTLPFEDDSFDHVFSSEVLEHVFNYEQILPELYRVLRKNGSILITVPFSWEEHEIPFDNCRFTHYGIKSLLLKHGFSIVKSEKTGHFFAVICQYFINYIRELIFTKNKYFNLLLNFVFIFPFTLISILLSLLAPRKKSLYFNTVILAQK
ncbi:MAG: class I SAM-dependent methyltransferase [Bacteroidales bacterium]|nr:class I SAM-dependent methyltransferase [Bacteroidales bacterium]